MKKKVITRIEERRAQGTSEIKIRNDFHGEQGKQLVINYGEGEEKILEPEESGYFPLENKVNMLVTEGGDEIGRSKVTLFSEDIVYELYIPVDAEWQMTIRKNDAPAPPNPENVSVGVEEEGPPET